MVYDEFEKNKKVCPSCNYHARINHRDRLEITVDKDSFEEFDAGMTSLNPIDFPEYEEKIAELMSNQGIIRNGRKIRAAIKNSVVFKEIQREFGSFDSYIRGFTDGKTVFEDYTVRTTSPLSDEISADLKKRGMSFVGSTVIYAFLQSIGIIYAHGKECDLYRE